MATSVELEWRTPRTDFTGTAWRRGPGGDVVRLATLAADGASRVVYRDSTTEYEQEYCYWLVDATTLFRSPYGSSSLYLLGSVSGAILNVTLRLLNERTFDAGNGVIKSVPL